MLIYILINRYTHTIVLMTRVYSNTITVLGLHICDLYDFVLYFTLVRINYMKVYEKYFCCETHTLSLLCL